MGSKAIVLFGLFLATILLISSEVAAARELAQASNTVDTSEVAEETSGAVDAAKYGGYPGGGYGGGRGGYGGGRGGYGGGRCRYGCCGRSYNGGGCRCCSYAGEKADAEPEAKPQGQN